MYLFLIFPSFFLLRDKEAIKKQGRSNNEEGKKQDSSLFLMKQNMLNKLIGGIKIRLKISIFYGEKVVHLADF